MWSNWYDFIGIDTKKFIQDKNKWIKFCKEKNVKSLDNGTFNQVDNRYIIKTSKLCKNCSKEAKSGCCDLYNHKERTSKKVVYNMEFFTF